MARVRWLAGSLLTADALSAEHNDLAGRHALHERKAHADGAVGARIRAVDGSVELSMPLARSQPRSWVVSVGREILALAWTAGAKAVGRVNGNLRSERLHSHAVRFTQAIPAPEAPKPFRLFRQAADRKQNKREMVVIELASPPDPDLAKEQPLPGLRIGPASPDGFLPLLEIQPGRGVVMRGTRKPTREIVRKPHSSGVSDEQLVQAFMNTDAGKAAREQIQTKGKNIKIQIINPVKTTIDATRTQVAFGWSFINTTDMNLKRLEVLAAIAPADRKTPAIWTKLPYAGEKPLAPTKPAEGRGSIVVPSAAPSPMLWVIAAAEADYGVAVTTELSETRI
jgi:hypothetical protein